MVHPPTRPARFCFGGFELQLDERQLLSEGAVVPLRPLAFDVLAVLAQRPGHLVTKAELLRLVWGTVVVEENTLQAHISALRKVLGRDAIATVAGQGYRFTLDVAPAHGAPDATPRLNLPQPLTSFIGREREIAQVRKHVADTRLLTLTGAGGCGKTRLAMEVAAASAASFADGARFVELAPLSDPTMIVQALARSTGVDGQSGQDLGDAVLDRLRPQRLLLVLDNAEHLRDACAAWAERLLQQCPGLNLLVTSRERLGVDGEMAWRVPSLSLPSGKAGEDPMASEAARLFVERARLHRPDFELAADDVPTLASVCQHLDGIALAIELAAAQMRMMSLKALDRRLDDRFSLLGNGSRNVLPRHQTLRALIDWSHERLTLPEQTLLRRVAVFAGGWTLESAASVCAGDGLDAKEIWGLLTALVDKSLVVAYAGGDDARFGMLETVRHFSLQRLAEAGETAAVRDRHLSHALDLASGLDPGRADAEVEDTLRRLEVENDNLRAALAWCESSPERALTGLQLAGRLNWFWGVQSQYQEGRAWVARLLSAAGNVSQGEAHAAALHTSGVLAALDNDPVAAAVALRAAIALWRQLGNRRELARSLITLSDAEDAMNDPEAARRHAEETLAIARELQEPRTLAFALVAVADRLHLQGEYAAARRLLEEGHRVAGAVGPWVEGYMANVLGQLLHGCGDLDAARRLLTESVEKLSGFGDPENLAASLLFLAQVCQDVHDLPAARRFLQVPLDQYPNIYASGQLGFLGAFAGLLSELADPLAGARLWGCLQRQSELKPFTEYPWWQPRQERLQQAARDALQDDLAFDRAWNEGRGWSLDQAFRYARTLA